MAVLSNTGIRAGASAAGGDDAYQIEKSVKFNRIYDGGWQTECPFLMGVQPGWAAAVTWSVSFWFKLGYPGNMSIFRAGASNTDGITIGTNAINVLVQDGATINYVYSQQFMDTHGWTHVVVCVDTDPDTTTADRVKLWLNGVRTTGTTASTTQGAMSTGGRKIGIKDTGWVIGTREATGTTYAPFDGLLADFYYIDGKACTASDFGEKDTTTGQWNPKTFDLKQVNDGTTWSSHGTHTISSSGSFLGGNEVTKIFDGSSSTNGNWTDGSDWTWSGLAIPCNHGLRFDINAGGYGGEVKVVTDKGTCNQKVYGGWNDFSELLPFGTTKITSISVQNPDISLDGNAWAAGVRQIEVDNKVLIDGTTDVDWDTWLTNSPNNGKNWSKGGESQAGTADSALWCDGSVQVTGDGWLYDSTYRVFTEEDIPVTTKLEFWHNGGGTTTTIEDGDGNIYQLSSGGNTWVTMQNGNSQSGTPFTGTLSGPVKIKQETGSSYLEGVRVDGYILLDNVNARDGGNSFNLKFNDGTSNPRLGWDSMGGKLDNSVVKPIHAVTDAQGRTKGSGYTTDSNSANLVLAMAGYDLTDSHAAVKGSGSAKTVTAEGNAVVSTDNGRFYGKSFKLDGDGDYIQSSQTDDCRFSGQFTVETWFYAEDLTSSKTILWSGGTGTGRYLIWSDGGTIKLTTYTGNTPSTRITGPTIHRGTWYHVALTRDGSNNVRLWLNGVQVGADWSNSDTLGGDADSTRPALGGQGANWWKGYFQDARFYSTCKYTATFKVAIPRDFLGFNFYATGETQSTTVTNNPLPECVHADATGGKPIYNVTGTYGETKGTGYATDSNASDLVFAYPFDDTSGLTDVSPHADLRNSGSAITLTKVGSGTGAGGVSVNAQLSGHHYNNKVLFLGNDANTYYELSNTQTFAASAHTFEFWCYFTGERRRASAIVYNGSIGAFGTHGGGWQMLIGRENTAGSGNDVYYSATYMEPNYWHHVAFCRGSSNTVNMFINGKKDTNTFTSTGSNPLKYIGSMHYVSGRYYPFDGYVQDMRLYDTEKYTADFKVTRIADTHSTVMDRTCVDSPTSYGSDTGAGGEVRGNYPAWDPKYNDRDYQSKRRYEHGNLVVRTGKDERRLAAVSRPFPKTGKWYCELQVGGEGTTDANYQTEQDTGWMADAFVGIMDIDKVAHVAADDPYKPGDSTGFGFGLQHGDKNELGTLTSYAYSGTVGVGSVVGIAVDMDNNKIYWYRNNSLLNSGGTSITSGKQWILALSDNDNVGGDPPDMYAPSRFEINFGQYPFKYNAPAGFKCLVDTNLEDPPILNPSAHFTVHETVGNGTSGITRTIHTPFEPGLVWSKALNDSSYPVLYDKVRGVTKAIYSGSNVVEATVAEGVKTFDTDKFTLGNAPIANKIGTYISHYIWGGGTSTTISAGDSDYGSPDIGSTCYTNRTAGFSIVKFDTGGAAGDKTVAHNLGAQIDFMIYKNLETADDDNVFSKGFAYFYPSTPKMNESAARWTTTAARNGGDNLWGSEDTWDNNTFSFNMGGNIASNNDCIAYCFAEIDGYSKFGSYTGSTTNRPSIYLGFQPRWLLIRRIDSADDWLLFTYDRQISEGTGSMKTKFKVLTNTNGQEDNSANYNVWLESNGFWVNDTNAKVNANTGKYIYAAFARRPEKYSRAR